MEILFIISVAWAASFSILFFYAWYHWGKALKGWREAIDGWQKAIDDWEEYLKTLT